MMTTWSRVRHQLASYFATGATVALVTSGMA